MVGLRFSLPFPPSLDESNCPTGNFHALLLFRNDEELAIVREAVHRMVERAIKMEGTCKFAFYTTTTLVGFGFRRSRSASSSHRHRRAWRRYWETQIPLL